MLYVVIRQIENNDEAMKRDHRVFILLSQAKQYYADVEHVCWNEPNDTPEADPSVVTNCWLWAADTDDPVAAAGMALSQRAILLAECFPPEKD
jgi:hypothetical protein